MEGESPRSQEHPSEMAGGGGLLAVLPQPSRVETGNEQLWMPCTSRFFMGFGWVGWALGLAKRPTDTWRSRGAVSPNTYIINFVLVILLPMTTHDLQVGDAGFVGGAYVTREQFLDGASQQACVASNVRSAQAFHVILRRVLGPYVKVHGTYNLLRNRSYKPGVRPRSHGWFINRVRSWQPSSSTGTTKYMLLMVRMHNLKYQNFEE